MSMDFQDRVALVTGASRGIGKAVALKLASEGASLTICARGREHLDRTASDIRETGADVLVRCADINDEAIVIKTVEQTVERFGRIDVLVNSAGGNGIIKPILELTESDWQYDLSQNFLGVVRFCQAAIPHMLKHGYGRIVNISSIAGIQPSPLYAPYCVAKTSIISYSKAISEAFSHENILSNVVLPGLVDTDQMAYVHDSLAVIWDESSENIRRSFEKETILNRYATPNEVAELIVFLASARTSYITGATYLIDGGMVKAIV